MSESSPVVLPGPLVDADWLADHLADVAVVHVGGGLGQRPGREVHQDGRVPGAVYLDLDTDLAGPPSPTGGRHPLPTPVAFAAVLGRAGIPAGRPVVAYDDARGSIAARLWWMLHVLGEPVALLDGGLAAWSGPLERGSVAVAPVDRGARPWPAHRFVAIDDVEAARDRPDAALVDARAAARYAHGDPAIDPRPGHIPGAVNRPWTDNVDPTTGAFRPAVELRTELAALGLASGPVVAYCGSGVTACHDLFALHRAGLDDTALFVGSWSAWGADEARPTELG